MRSRAPRRWCRSAVICTAAFVFTLFGGPAWAGQGSIDHVQAGTDQVNILYSISALAGETPDLGTLSVSLDGQPLDAVGRLASEGPGTVRRTAVLAIDVSDSMSQGGRIEQAQLAAKAFLDNAPPDLAIGIVTFAGDIAVAQEPSLDRAKAAAIVDGLTLSRGTRLYEGVQAAIRAVGGEGARNILVLSDGQDTSNTALDDVVADVSGSDVQVDVVALGLSEEDDRLLQQIANAGGGQFLNADDPEALTQLFATQAEELARQILVTATLPADLSATEGTLTVSVESSDELYTDDAFVTVRTASAPTKTTPTELQPAPTTGLTVTSTMMWAGLGALGLGAAIVLAGAFGVLGGASGPSVEERVAAYSLRSTGRKRAGKARAESSGGPGVSTQVRDLAQRTLDSNKSVEAALGARLEAAGMAIKPAEWLLFHSGLAFGLSLMGLLVSSGNMLAALGGLTLGAILPWVYLGLKRARRVKAFKAQLADTLQLMSGSLSAGLSLAQSVDTVVREGSPPIANEFRRALVEARLGVEIEEALESIADRMDSRDFRWIVMAIRIQREVGGNLAELLTTVAETIREREYLERQVQALSAEGRLSVWILGGLPPGFMAYLLVANPEYLAPMFKSLLGWTMLGMMAFLITVGVFWMKKLVKVEV